MVDADLLPISPLIWIGLFVLWMVLIIKAYQDQKLVLPIIGPLAEKQAGAERWPWPSRNALHVWRFVRIAVMLWIARLVARCASLEAQQPVPPTIDDNIASALCYLLLGVTGVLLLYLEPYSPTHACAFMPFRQSF